MTGRSVAEWVGSTPDAPIPPRVRLRTFERAGGRCAACERKIGPADTWQCDHVVALVNGGANAEANLQVLCGWCHRAKTADDVAEKSRSARIRARHLGVRSGPVMPGSRRSKFKKKLSGEVVLR
jgi:5-methylcytosine-specific restriction protein A